MANPDTDGAQSALERQAARQRESEHRAKNTLQLISSIVLLQGRRVADPAARQALKSVLQRVAAISVAHRHVTWADESEQVELAGLVREIVGDLANSAGRSGVMIDLDLEPTTIPGRQAAPAALLIGESVGNALRHAFPEGQSGRIQVSLQRTAEGCELSVSDNGVGYPSDGPSVGFGLTVVQLMTQQLRGKFTTEAAQPGLRLSVTIPLDKASPRA